jgi:murein DD-endopeptidase MepM/ murein hydrolase activator NlpD
MLDISNLLEKNRSNFHSVFPFALNKLKIWKLDLSINNPELQNYDILHTEGLDHYIQTKLSEEKADICIGGYLEDRLIYRKSTHFGTDDNARTIHLGIDVWSEAKTPLFAPLDSVIHSFQINDNFGDYGPTIILSHELNGQKFHTLYGHLSEQSLENCSIGKRIKKGDPFAALGAQHENGNWPPHLHFQVIVDMENKQGDYPGVCSKADIPKYSKNCPNPAPLLEV